MLDLVGAIGVTGIYALVIGLVVGLSPIPVTARLAALAGAAAWAVVIVAAGAAGGFAPGALGPIPAPVLAFVVALALLFGGWTAAPRFRAALLAVPLPALVGVNVARLGGAFFLLLEAQHRLSAPFAPIAGEGDMLVGALAIPLALLAAAGAARWTPWIAAWNALGALDLIIAVTLGLTSAPGTPLRVFTDEPGTRAMTELPWVMVPAMLVPLFLLIHLAVATRLRSLASPVRAVATAH